MRFTIDARLAPHMRKAWHDRMIWPLLLAWWLNPAMCLADDTASTIATIARAWKSRESRVSTLDCEWSAEEVCGAKTWVYRDEKGERFALPSDDLTINADYRFRLQGLNKMRYESMGPQPNEDTRNYEMREYVSVTDGEEQKSYYGKDQESKEPRFAPLGFINEKETLPEITTIHLWPLLILYRSSTPEVAKELDLVKFSPKGQITIAGRDCLLLERSVTGMGKCELVIDMNRGCVPLRVCRLLYGSSKGVDTWFATYLIEIDYVDEADGSWRPKGWKTAIMGEGGKVREQMKASVKRFAINVSVPDSVFKFDFPVGTKVRNWKTKERYLLREGGEKRYITEAEGDARVPYRRLLATNTGEGLGGHGIPWRAVLLGICGSVLLLWIVRFIYLGHRRRRGV